MLAAVVQATETVGLFRVFNCRLSLVFFESLVNAAHRCFSLPTVVKAVELKGVGPLPFTKNGTGFAPEQEKALEWKDFVSMVYTNDGDAQQHWPKECK